MLIRPVMSIYSLVLCLSIREQAMLIRPVTSTYGLALCLSIREWTMLIRPVMPIYGLASKIYNCMMGTERFLCIKEGSLSKFPSETRE